MLEATDQRQARDEEIVASIVGGDVEKFSCLYDRYRSLAYRLAYAMTGERGRAEDMTQEIFIRAYNSLCLFRGEASFRTWFYRLAVNCCLNCRRREKQSSEPITGLHEAVANTALEPVESAILRRQVQAEVHRALLSLKPKQRLLVILRDIEGLSYEEIAERTNYSRGTIASRLNRARRLLARKLERLRSSL